METTARDFRLIVFSVSIALSLVFKYHVIQKKPLRLAIISVHSNPLERPEEMGTNGKGGQNIYVREVSEQLSSLGFNVTVFTRSDSLQNNGTFVSSPTLKVRYIVAGPQQHLHRDKTFLHLDDFASQINPAEFDAVFTHYWLSGYVGLKLGLPHIHTHHSLGVLKFQWETLTEIGAIRLAVEQEINENAHIIHQLRNENRITNATKGKYITPGINMEYFKNLNKVQSRKKLNFDSNVTNVLYVGRFAQQKGIKFALEALSKTKVPITFRLIGGYKNSTSEHLLEQYPQFNYLGPKPMDEVAEYMSASDIMVVPSLYEPFGLVVLEGMAAGCSMLVSAVGGPDQLIENGVNGVKVPPGNTDAILKAFEALAGNKTVIREMGERNRKVGLQNSWRKTAERIADVIVEITHL